MGQEEYMTEEENIELYRLLEKFVNTYGLDQMEAGKKASELLAIINEQ